MPLQYHARFRGGPLGGEQRAIEQPLPRLEYPEFYGGRAEFISDLASLERGELPIPEMHSGTATYERYDQIAPGYFEYHYVSPVPGLKRRIRELEGQLSDAKDELYRKTITVINDGLGGW